MSEQIDQELNLKAIIGFAIGLLVVISVSAALLWQFSKFLRSYEAAQDPPPPALAAARSQYTPPGPALQVDPEHELTVMRSAEEAMLDSYGWVDRPAGIVRIPIERAISLMVGDEGAPIARSRPADSGSSH